MNALHLHDALRRRKARPVDNDVPDTLSLTAREAFWLTVAPIAFVVAVVVAIIVAVVNR